MKVIAEVLYEIEVDDDELVLYRECGLSDLMTSKGLMAAQFDEILYEEVETNDFTQ